MLLYGVALLWVVLDQFSKYFILETFGLGQSLPILPPIFHLTLVHNTGIAFGLFQNSPFVLTTLIAVCVLALLFFSYKIFKKSSYEQIAYGLILGGAIGNLIDRVRFGWVVDFLDFRIWPVFNLADSGITIGVILFAWTILFGHENKKTV
jgi:signal peptidase II